MLNRRNSMIKTEDLDDIHQLLIGCGTIHNLAEKYVFEEPEDKCFIPFRELICEGFENYEKEHPSTPIFKNGVYVNDDSEYLAHGIIYAANTIDVSEMLPNYDKLSPRVICEFRYALTLAMFRYIKFYEASPKGIIYNEHTLNWDNLCALVCKGANYGDTFSI